MPEKLWLLVSVEFCSVKLDLTKFTLTGIKISGLEGPLTVGQQPPTITCRTNTPVSSIEWRDQSSHVVASTTHQTVLEYLIPVDQYVLDTYHGRQYTCQAVATSNGATTTYTETVELQLVGRYGKYHPIVVWSYL